MDRFNGLSAAEDERLVVAHEELDEVGKCICKIQRHGYESNNNGQLPETNREALERELGDLFHAIHRLCNAGDIDMDRIVERATSEERSEHCKKYLHHNEK